MSDDALGGGGPSAASPRAPRQERGRRRIDEILDAAEQLLLEQGPGAASIQEIARRAGASVGSIYHFFPTKEAILTALQARFQAESEVMVGAMRANLTAATDLPLAAWVDRFLTPFAEFVERRPAAFVLGGLLGDRARPHEEDPEMRAAMRTALRRRDPRCSEAELERRLQVLFVIGTGVADLIIRHGAAGGPHYVTEMKRAMYGYLLVCESADMAGGR